MTLPIVTVFAWIQKDGKILLIQEGGWAKGTWCLPGGHIDEGESLEQGLVREVKEEAGYVVAPIAAMITRRLSGWEYRGNREEAEETIELHIYQAKITGGELREGKEELGAGWFSFDQVGQLRLRWPWLIDLWPK